jgi:glutathione S-transferase
MFVLYHFPASRSCRVRWLLEELALPYELVTLDRRAGDLRKPEYLAKNPLGTVPTLEDGAIRMFESGAIVEHLLETRAKGRLAPAPGSPERPAFLQWLHWSEGTLLPPIADIAQHSFVRPPETRIAAVVPDAQARLRERLDVLDRELAGRDYLLPSGFSAADVTMGYGVWLAKLLRQLPAELANATAYIGRLEQRPAFQRAFA